MGQKGILPAWAGEKERASMNIPRPAMIYRIIHVNNLAVILHRGGMHAPNHTPTDDLTYHTIHNVDIQNQRQSRPIRCGPGGAIHDYVAFYFGPRSPMLYQLHTGWVDGYCGGQEPLIYLVSSAEAIARAELPFVYSDGHGIAAFTQWYDDLAYLDRIDWSAAYAKLWRDTVEDMDRQRRKQAEFLVHQRRDWCLIHEIGVVNESMKMKVRQFLAEIPTAITPPVNIRREWYY